MSTTIRSQLGIDWKEFRTIVSGKAIVVYGVADNLSVFQEKFGNEIIVSAIIDGDSRKQSLKAGQFVGRLMYTAMGEIRVSGIDALDNYNPDNTVVVIGGKRAYIDIIKRLEKRGFTNCFVVNDLEGSIGGFIQNQISYAKKCMDKPIENNKIVVLMGYNGEHGRCISEQILDKRKDVKICWIMRTQKEVIDGVEIIYEGDWKRYIYEMETARVWIMDEPVPEFIMKRPKQIYIQTKHWGSITLKKFYFDVEGRTREKIKRLEHGFAGIDYVFTGSDLDDASCRSGFRFDGTCVRLGSPRSDLMFDESLKAKVCKYYNLPEDCRFLLYAPTYREIRIEQLETDLYLGNFEIQRVRDEFKKRFGGNWIALMRLHPLNAAYLQGTSLGDGIIDASQYENGIELASAADALISDYSSIMFELAFVKRPVFVYAPDKEEYLKNERGFLIDLESLPFPISKTNDELIGTIDGFDLSAYRDRVDHFLEDHGVSEDGHASERAADFILGLLK